MKYATTNLILAFQFFSSDNRTTIVLLDCFTSSTVLGCFSPNKIIVTLTDTFLYNLRSVELESDLIPIGSTTGKAAHIKAHV